MPEACIEFYKKLKFNDWHGIFTRTRLCGMLQGKAYRAPNRLFFIVAAFKAWNFKHERTVQMARMSKRYIEVVAHVTGDMGQSAWSQDDLRSLGRKMKEMKGYWSRHSKTTVL